MNWAAISVFSGLVALALFTWPFGIVILAGMWWVYWKS